VSIWLPVSMLNLSSDSSCACVSTVSFMRACSANR
jgi:hypothetical protein